MFKDAKNLHRNTYRNISTVNKESLKKPHSTFLEAEHGDHEQKI